MRLTVVLTGLFLLGALSAQEPEAADSKKPQGEPLVTKAARTIEFSTDEATWMNLEVSPDGTTLLADVLGDLYTLPVTGGAMKPLTTGMAWDYQAKYSPDGKQIVFVSDREGSDNLWIMNADGTGARSLTHEKKFLFGSPAWSPDGEYIVARRWGTYPFDSYLRKSELWMFHKDGGAGIQLTKGEAARTRVTGPEFSPDGKYLYFSAAGGRYNYNVDLGKWQIQRLNRETGEISAITSAYGGGLRPVISRDGRMMLYATRHDGITGLRLRDLETRTETWLSHRITRDDQESFSSQDTLPSYGFTPDNKAVFLTVDGRIHRLEVATKKDELVPFICDVKRELGALLKVDDRVPDGPLNVKQLRWLQAGQNADASTLLFSALGKLWTSPAGGSQPKRLTKADEREYEPALSPDGKWVAWVTWSDRNGGHLWKAHLDGSDATRLSKVPAYYSLPKWSPDGSQIAFVMGSSAGWLDEDDSNDYELRISPAAGGDSVGVTHLRSPNSNVTWSPDGKRLFYDEANQAAPGADTPPTTSLVSVRTDGVDKKTVVRFTDRVSALPSPNGKWMLLERYSNCWLAALPTGTTEPVTLNPDSPSVPLKQVTAGGANYLRWLPDSSGFTYAFTNRLFQLSREDVLKSAKVADLKPVVREVTMSAPREMGHGQLVLRNARILTMKGDEVIENGDLVIQDSRIVAVGARGKVAIPAGAKQMDLAGKTIMPGMVDIHAHLHAPGDVFPDKVWPYAANLAYGVTTTRDPSIDSNRVFPYSEMVESGDVLGPRIYSTGTAMTTNAVRVESQQEARDAVHRYKEAGADYLKQYMQPRRSQRQWILEAARAEGINITAEGGGFLKEDLAMVIDGYTGFEHNYPVKIFRDVIELTARAQTIYTPTLIVSYGGPFGQYYWRQRRNYHADEKLGRFTPHEELDRKARRVMQSPEEDYFFKDAAAGAAAIYHQGGQVALGSHGEQQGIGAHWELWMLQSGGLTPMETLHVATINGARALGLEKDLGSLEAGKVADLIVLDKNPLESIYNSESIRWVMKAGELYEGGTLNRTWPSERKMDSFWWTSELK